MRPRIARGGACRRHAEPLDQGRNKTGRVGLMEDMPPTRIDPALTSALSTLFTVLVLPPFYMLWLVWWGITLHPDPASAQKFADTAGKLLAIGVVFGAAAYAVVTVGVLFLILLLIRALRSGAARN